MKDAFSKQEVLDLLLKISTEFRILGETNNQDDITNVVTQWFEENAPVEKGITIIGASDRIGKSNHKALMAIAMHQAGVMFVEKLPDSVLEEIHLVKNYKNIEPIQLDSINLNNLPRNKYLDKSKHNYRK